MNYNINISKNTVETAREVALLIFEKVHEKEKNSYFNIALSGGKTPDILFEILATEFVNVTDWKRVRFFWVDERCVPPEHPESNFGAANRILLNKITIPDENIFRIKGEEFPEEEADRYSRILSENLPSENGYPVFDMILLGIGDDGHTASIFPDQMHLNNCSGSVAVAIHPVSGQKRVTLTGNTIRNAGIVVFMATGKSKALIVNQIIKGEKVSENYPATYMGNNKQATIVYIDEAAAEELK